MTTVPAARFATRPIPARAGIGLRGDHYRDVLETLPALAFLEVHSENFFGRGGPPHHYLSQIAERYPLCLHGVGLSLGAADDLDSAHLARLRELVDAYRPALVSEHLSWSSVDGRYTNDLLPLPYTDDTIDHLARKIDQVQQALSRPMLVENVSCYLEFAHNGMPEWEFVNTVAARADCGILLDVNNVYVNACNHGFDALTYLDEIDPGRVAEIHLAGHTVNTFEDGRLLIDTHDQPVTDAVWELYRYGVERIGPRPTLIEWDSKLPPLATLLGEAATADRIITESAGVCPA